MEKERWKEEVLRSLEGAKRAEPAPGLYAGIRSRLAPMQVVRRPYVALAAACLAVLITANVWALHQRQVETPASSVSVYQVDNARFDLY